MNEAELAMQIAAGGIKIMLDGTVLVLKVAGKASVHAAALLAAALSGSKKTKGRVRLTEMLKDKSGLTLFTIKKEEIEKFANAAKAYGIKYCVIKDKNAKDDRLTDIFVRGADAPVINRIVEKYALSAVKQDVEIGGDRKQEKSELRTETGHPSGKDCSEEFKTGDITINKEKLLVDENETSYVTRVPGTYGENVRYLTLEKKDTEPVYNDLSIKYNIKREAEYKLTDAEGNVVSVSGEKLLSFYDKKDKDHKVHSEEEMRPSVRKKLKAAEQTAADIKEYVKSMETVGKAEIYKTTDEKSRTDMRKKYKQNTFNDFSQRTYDFAELEKKLVNRSPEREA